MSHVHRVSNGINAAVLMLEDKTNGGKTQGWPWTNWTDDNKDRLMWKTTVSIIKVQKNTIGKT